MSASNKRTKNTNNDGGGDSDEDEDEDLFNDNAKEAEKPASELREVEVEHPTKQEETPEDVVKDESVPAEVKPEFDSEKVDSKPNSQQYQQQ